MKILQYKGVGSPSEYTQNGVRLTLQVQVSVFLGTLSGQCIKHAETGPEHRWIATSPNWALAWLVLRPKSALPGQDGHLGPMALKLLVAIWLGTPIIRKFRNTNSEKQVFLEFQNQIFCLAIKLLLGIK